MTQIRPKILLASGRQNEPIRIPFDNLLLNTAKTVLVSDMASAVTALTVKNITGFAKNQVILIGEPGNQSSEIAKTHASTQPSGTTITLAAATSQAHSASNWLYVIGFDQVEVSNAPTVTGSKSVLVTTAMTPAIGVTLYNDIAGSTGYYFARFKNTITSTFSPYSDAVPVGGYTILTARSIIDNALANINKDQKGGLTDEYAFNELNNFQYEVLKSLKRWSWMQSFDTFVTSAAVGYWRIAAPSDLDDQNTNKSVYNLRLSKEREMIWVDKEKFNEFTQGMAYTTLANALAVGATSVTLTNSRDFSVPSGTVRVGNSQIAYTANNVATGVLTIPAALTAYAVGVYAFQGESTGNPRYWTAYGGYLYHWPLVGSSYKNRSYYLDYYKTLTQITLDSDSIVVPDPVMAQNYLCWKFLRKLNNGEETQASKEYELKFLQGLKTLKDKETMNRTFQLKPRYNNFAIQSQAGYGDDRKTRLGNFPDA